MRRPAVDPLMQDQVVARRNQIQGMAGGRVPSAWPVPRIRLPRMLGGLKGTEAPAGPLYWWKFDEASGDAVESVSNAADIVYTGAITGYHAAALAPGSSFATELPANSYYGVATFATGLDEGADGLLVIDFWVSGLPAPVSLTSVILAIENANVGQYRVDLHNSDSLITRVNDGGALDADLPSWADPAHIRWELGLTAGTSTLFINGTQVHSATGYDMDWDTSSGWVLVVSAGADAAATFDELKIYGKEV